MTYQTLEYEVKGRVAWIRLNRPENGNAINESLSKDLMDAAWECEQDDNVRAVVVTGNGKPFSFGGDLKSFASHGAGVSKHLKDVTVYLHEAINRFAKMKKPVITGVNGAAAGAGMSLAMIGDLCIAVESAKFTMAYTNIGLTPDGSASYFLPRIVGVKRALELTLTNRVLTASEAQEWGIVTKVVSDEAFENELEELANRMAEGPVAAFGSAKALIYGSDQETLESQMAKESASIAKHASLEEGKEGIAAFLEKRKANFVKPE